MAAQKIGIIGHGNVGSALERGLKKAGHDVRAVGSDPAAVRETALWAKILLLAVPFGAVDAAVKELDGAADGKTLIDVTNAIGANMSLTVGHTTSGAEELQRKLPAARVVKAFNTTFAHTMDTGRVGNQPITVFAAGDDADAKAATLALARDIGFDAVDAGPLKEARLLEPLALLNIHLAYVQGLGPQMGFKLIH